MRTINHESDFKIREQREDGTPIWNAPFRFTYYVKMSRGTFVASYDGREFINCHKGTGEDEGKLIVAFDSPQFGTGVLRVKREFFLNDTDFADGVRHYVSDESTDVILDRGATSEGIVVDAVFNPSYYKGDRGLSAYEVWLSEGNKGSVEDYFAYIKGDKGDTGVGIKDVKQTVSSSEDEGRNTIRVTMTNGDYYEFYIRNGSKGEKGDKGSTFTYDDLTQAQKEDLARQVIGDAEDERRAAEQVRQQNETKRESQEAKRTETFNANQAKREQAFASSQSQMARDFQSSEASRSNTFSANEVSRQSTADASELSRKQTFNTNEQQRQNTFSTNEAARQSQEAERVVAEGARESAEALRKQAEQVREATFATNENTRQRTFESNEALRQENETKRVDAEILRQEAETIREATYKNKVDRDDNAPELTAGFANNLVGRGEATSQEISFRPSGGDTSIEDGTARIERLKGSTVVWNQIYPTGWTTKQQGVTSASSDGIISLNGTTAYTFLNLNNGVGISSIPYAHKGLYHLDIINDDNDYLQGKRFDLLNRGINTAIEGKSASFFYVNNDETSPWGFGFSKTAVGDTITDVKIRVVIYDLTQMFGAGNEPTTIEDFHAMKPLNIDEYAYNEGELISNNVEELKSVGFNAWDEEWEPGMILGQNGSDQGGFNQIRGKGYIRIIPSTTYEILCKSNKTQGFIVVGYDEDFRYTGWLRYGGNYGAFTTRENDRYIRFCTYAVNYGAVYNHDICIHLVHTGYRNGEYEPYKEFRRNIPIKGIKDKDGNQLFPKGLLSAGSAYDEITATKAIKRIGMVDMGTLSWERRVANTQGVEWNHFITSLTFKPNRPSAGGVANAISPLYECAASNALKDVELHDKTYMIYHSGDGLFLRDDSYTDADALKAALSGVMLYYELAEPIEVDLPEPLNLDYEVSDFGTEEVISDAPTTPMKADIVYLFNAVDRIRDNSRHTAESAELLNAKADKTAVEAAINELTNAIPEVVNDLTTGGADRALSAEMGKVIAGKVDVLHREINMGLVIEDIFPSISDSFVPKKYPVFSGGNITTAGSTNTIGYYLLSGELLQECYSIKALLQCDGASPAAIAFYSSDNDFRAGTYLGGVQHKNTKGEWFEAEIPSEAKACLITNRKTETNNADPVILGLKKEKLLSEIVNIKKETEGPDRYQEEHLGDIVLSPTTTTGSIKIDCTYGDIIKVVADANVKSFFLGTKSYGREILGSVSGNQTLYIVLKEKVVNLFAYSAVNNSLQRTISVYKCAKKGLYEYPNLVGSFFRYYTPTIGKNDWIIGKTTGADGTISTSHKRATTGVLDLKNPSIRVSVSDTVNFRFYILSYLKGSAQDHGWKTSYETNIECESLAITIERTDGKGIVEDDLNVISVEFLEPVIEDYVGEKDFKELNSRVEELRKQNEFNSIGSVNNILNVTKPYYYHFKPDSFITDGNGRKAIPSQTSYDIELASRLGFTSIEANIHATSDGNFICMHGSAGNFGSTVLSLDGSDISATSIGTKTLQWIKDNVRFKSDYEKYKVAPLSLEEFCSCCRSNGIGIFAGTGNTDAINTCVRMLGTDNVMLYGAGASKRSIFKGMMFEWVNSASTTIDNILTTARNYGLPFMYGLGPSLLSALVANNQLGELCSKMHAEGFTLASTAVYDTDENTLNAFNQGVDFSASGHQVNNFEPNYFVHSLDDDTSISGTATITDGYAILNSGQTVICGKEDKIIGKAILNIRYAGKLTINFGSAGNRTITSDGSEDIVLSDYFFKKNTTLTITAESDTMITNLVYKASVC